MQDLLTVKQMSSYYSSTDHFTSYTSYLPIQTELIRKSNPLPKSSRRTNIPTTDLPWPGNNPVDFSKLPNEIWADIIARVAYSEHASAAPHHLGRSPACPHRLLIPILRNLQLASRFFTRELVLNSYFANIELTATFIPRIADFGELIEQYSGTFEEHRIFREEALKLCFKPCYIDYDGDGEEEASNQAEMLMQRLEEIIEGCRRLIKLTIDFAELDEVHHEACMISARKAVDRTNKDRRQLGNAHCMDFLFVCGPVTWGQHSWDREHDWIYPEDWV